MYNFNEHKLQDEIASIIEGNVAAEVWTWVSRQAAEIKDGKVQSLPSAFAATPRKTGRQPIEITAEQNAIIQEIRLGLNLTEWTIDRLCRVWFILHFNAADKEQYIQVIETLFVNADMNEQVALYAALPVLAYAEVWRNRCAEGIRSNIGDVLEAIMCNNPYPAEQLDEQAWNQLVLKAIFTEKAIDKTFNLQQRSNQKLTDTLSDFAHERWAAKRTVNPLLWQCVTHFLNENIFHDIERLSNSDNVYEQEAAALVCNHSEYRPAKQLLNANIQLKNLIQPELNWQMLANKINADKL